MIEPSNLFDFFLLITFTCIVLLIFLKKRNKSINYHYYCKLPPSPPSLPILGHLHLLKQPLHQTLLNLTNKFGPVLLLRLGFRRVVVVTSPSAVEECFTRTNDIVLANRPLTSSLKHFNYNYTTIGAAPYGHLWRSLRRVAASELLSTTRLDATTHLREHEVQLMCRQIINNNNQVVVDLKAWFRDLLSNITTTAVMGKRYYGDEIDDVGEATAFQGMMEEMFRLIHTPSVGDFLPLLGWVQGVEKKMIRLMKRVDKFLQEVIAERRRIGNCESGIMVDKLLALQQEEPTLYTDEIIKGVILAFLVAGIETPYLSMEWCMSLLLNNPKAMETINNEINTHVGSDRLLQESDLGKLSYLENAINESLRLYPTLPVLLSREASEDIVIGGYSVPRGTMLMVNAWAIHRDPLLWDKPDSFIPERFETMMMKDKYQMLAFGVGRRGCPGTNLGCRVLGLALGTLIQVFEWKKINDEDVDMTAFYGLSMAKLNPLQVFCKPRSNMIPHIYS